MKLGDFLAEVGEKLTLHKFFNSEPLGKYSQIKLATLFGVPLFVHWSGWLLGALWVVSLGPALGLGLILCLLVHEYGHVVMARKSQVHVGKVLIHGIGAVALMGRPSSNRKMLWIALAGPIVSLALAGFFGLLNHLFEVEVLMVLAVVNLIWAIFNMLPILPLDGGRVLRSSLADKRGFLKSTQTVVRLGQIVAVGFAIPLLYGHLFLAALVLLGFAFLGARAELEQAEDFEDSERWLDVWESTYDPGHPCRELLKTHRAALEASAPDEHEELWKRFDEAMTALQVFPRNT